MLDLNTILSKILAKRKKTVWSSLKDFCTPQLCKAILEADSQVRCQVFGSVAENLEAPGPKNMGDLDVMIFSISENLMIHEQYIEYLAESPVHVRIKGIQNPALQSCLVQGTEYVGTSALRNYHPAIFSRSAFELLPFFLTLFSRFSRCWTVNSPENGPAATLLQARVESELRPPFFERYRHATALFGLSGKEPTTESPPCGKTPIRDESPLRADSFEIDLVPAFRSLEWPKVALEWITRDRCWPSLETVNNVVREGFHLVPKSSRNGGHPDRDFRISFSQAEYTLSQEMNDIHRECYFCLKKYRTAFFSTEPKGLVTYHLKNLFLRTIEETPVEMWTEQNRAKCFLKLLGNLLDALRKKYLPHYFVTSYNLFCYDYIESDRILETLAEKVEQIIENPIQFAEKLIDERTTVCGISGDSDSKEARTQPASPPAFEQPDWLKQQPFSSLQAIGSALASFQNPLSSIRPNRSKKRGGLQNASTDDIPLD